MNNKFPMVAKTFQGLEDVLGDELMSLGAENVEPGLRMVSFDGDLEMMYRANLCCRTALRILKPIVKFTADDTDELYDKVRDVEWEDFLNPDMTFSIDSTVNSHEFTHSRFVTYRVKDGIVDHFSDRCGRRPSIRVKGADIQLNVHIAENRVTISLDSSGEPLSRRGYRQEQTEAPLNEVMAAGIIMKSGWRGDMPLADPMCGSGTFLIEAALIAANINPGIYRRSFAFERWADFDKDLFEDIYNDDSGEREFGFKIYGGDIDPEAVATARRNIRSAGVEDMIELSCKPMADWTENPENGVVVMNPPYGERIKPDDMTALYKGIGTCLKRNFKGWNAWILGYRDEHFSAIGLKPSVKIPMLNGSLECSLREYVMFDGSYSEFRADGGSVANEEVRRGQEPRKMRRLSDDEWKKESRKFKGGRDDRKPFRGGERRRDSDSRGSGRDFGRDSGRERDSRSFRGGERRRDSGSRGSGRDFGRDSGRERDSKSFRDGRSKKRGPVEISNKGPRLPESSATVFNKVHIRSRKNSKKNTDITDNKL